MYADYIAELAEESPQLVFKKSMRKMFYVDNAFFVTFAGRFLRGLFVILEGRFRLEVILCHHCSTMLWFMVLTRLDKINGFLDTCFTCLGFVLLFLATAGILEDFFIKTKSQFQFISAATRFAPSRFVYEMACARSCAIPSAREPTNRENGGNR